LYFYRVMRPDYPHKIFADFRTHFFLLMETLAMLSPHSLKGNNRCFSLIKISHSLNAC
jgi:hypothetical protein